MSQKTIPKEQADKVLRIFDDWSEGRKVREELPKLLGIRTRYLTFFMRNYRFFQELDAHLGEIAKGVDSISAMTVGGGLSKPLRRFKAGAPALNRPMSWEPLELASCLERFKRESPRHLDWSLTVIERNPHISKVLETQRVVTVIPHHSLGYPRNIPYHWLAYARNFLPGAIRKTVDTDEYDEKTQSALSRKTGLNEGQLSSLKGVVKVVHVPSYYRERMRVVNKPIEDFNVTPESYNVALCIMGGDYIKNVPKVLGKLLHGLKPNGILASELTVSLAEIGEAGRYEKLEWGGRNVYRRR